MDHWRHLLLIKISLILCLSRLRASKSQNLTKFLTLFKKASMKAFRLLHRRFTKLPIHFREARITTSLQDRSQMHFSFSLILTKGVNLIRTMTLSIYKSSMRTAQLATTFRSMMESLTAISSFQALLKRKSLI